MFDLTLFDRLFVKAQANAQRRARILTGEYHIALRIHLMTGHAVRDIVRLATEIKADLVVIGATSRKGDRSKAGTQLPSLPDRVAFGAGIPAYLRGKPACAGTRSIVAFPPNSGPFPRYMRYNYRYATTIGIFSNILRLIDEC